MGGIGKTTIARDMFAKHFAQYDSVCFLEKVREESEKLGPTSVRNKLLNNAAQLEYLCGELGDLGPHSRLIITTRDRHTLSTRVDEIYEVTKWKFSESLKLFSLGAFNQSHPKEGYERLSERAVAHAGGIPLALKVLGLHFRSRNIKFWESELSYLENKEESYDEIREVLQVSYKGLTRREKEIFLDIAFFFKDENKDFVIRILDACGFNATSGIEILQDKALVTISNRNRIQMHDLLQKMAFDIVREESSRDPRKRSRLRDTEEVRDVLKNNKGTLSGMDTLFKSLPPSFYAKLLVEICLPHSNVEYLWHGKQELVNLEGIDLSECKQLMKLPDLSGASKLKWLYLSGCESLCDVQPSVFSKDTLVTLLLDRCKKLESLTSEKHLRSLEKINVYGCSSLKEFSLSSDSIENLDLSNTGIEILHSSIGHLGKLEWLNLEGLRLQNLPNELSQLSSLTELWISNCSIEALLFAGTSFIHQEFHADNCTTLVTVSTLKSFSKVMNGKEKCLSFKNDMELEGPLTQPHHGRWHINNEECCISQYIRSRVPKQQFRYRTTNSSITIGLPHLSYSLGFIFSVVVSPSLGMKKKEHDLLGAKIQCQCYSEDGKKVGHVSTWHHKTVTDLNSDHVYVCMKECGVLPIYFSEFRSLVGTMKLDSSLVWELTYQLSVELGSDLYEAMEFEKEGNDDIESVERCDEHEGNDIESSERSIDVLMEIKQQLEVDVGGLTIV
ncbi:P-loop containing nucleoside triphosphate hydrolase [Sesbania bispinosa]|nr:P-loop containing nucleoside triphosphate hydrolase [Sesbania bispinosa]